MKSFFAILFFFAVLAVQAQIPSADYKLVWQDEFDGQKLNSENWGYRSLGHRRDAYNIPECVTVQNGYLALRTDMKNDTVFSAMISTQKKFETTYGYFEIKCLLPTEQGHWSAFWLQSPLFGKFIGNPAKSGAEIDIMEYLPNKPNLLHHTLHYDGYGDSKKTLYKKNKVKKFNPLQWHTFGLEWTPNYYTYYMDGKAVATFTEGISMAKQYIILSLEVGQWAGNIREATLPNYFIIDYVRVYKKK